ncbi:DUF3237 family protein [Flavobacteriaceae bacterium XHP0103]|uniref:DUF3237 family protein n=1 Tax=Marixanthotalea marina TaxID=2844359 RepID=UPI002989AC8E|nr:DUF3237 family protein [Marixanthotalea marina]MBU3823062.1 DUF3237 family protein [Marixanthotalea marina]
MKRTLNKIYIIAFISIFTICETEAQTDANNDDTSIYKDFKTEHVWDAKVTIGNAISLGESKHGGRNIIPITGGTFEGPKIKGEVLPYGADWQLVRPDGDVELNARYLLKTDDGVTIQVINKVLIHNGVVDGKPESYIKSVIDLEAPKGSPYEYLNHAIFLGTLTIPATKPGETPYVIIGVYKVL